MNEPNPPSDTAQGLTAVHLEQQRVAIVLAGMQRDMGDISVSVANLRQLIQGGNGERSLLVRINVAEEILEVTQGMVKEQAKVTGAKLDEIMARLTIRAEENERRLSQILLWLAGVLVSFICAGGAALLTLLKR